ncbi:hypothetical protein KIN20_008655 [Parelaphostrongylus tenuis]|uniref:Uncharacterized protein n=1 Tax=Parelaphostrongylus tenuis TaxID=148309 RepID=A0AAD5MA10_PARTN|nr:hypothetical protein KIN20_008655 [Parelaphostrongylus tenuis]
MCSIGSHHSVIYAIDRYAPSVKFVFFLSSFWLICEISSFCVVWGNQQRQEQQQLVCAFGADHLHEGNRWKKWQ